MAAEAYTPIDEIGMPLPLAPTNLEIRDASQPKPDWHHHFHPRKSLILREDWGGDAVRNARVQLSDYRVHHNEYHTYYKGPELPETPQQKFGIAVLAIAGYVPAEAIAFKRGKPEIVQLTENQRSRLLTSGELKIAAPETLRSFLAEYTVKQDLTDADETLIDEFIHTRQLDRRYKLGGALLDMAIEKAVEPLDPFYRTAWKKGYIDRSSAHRPRRLLKTKIYYKSRQPKIIQQLHDELAA